MRRRVAVASLSDLAPGDHVCGLYHTESERWVALMPLLRQGLDRGEKVLCILGVETTARALDALRAEGLGLDPTIVRAQLRFLTPEDTYIQAGKFTPEGMIALMQRETERARREGYRALRVVSDIRWTLQALRDPRRLIEYEARLTAFLAASPCLAVCQYARRHVAPPILLDALHAHPTVMIGADLYENVYFVPPAQCLDRPEERLDHWIRGLTEGSRRQAAWQESEKRYHSLFEHGLSGVALYEIVADVSGRPAQYRCLDVNRAFETLTGLRADVFVGTCKTEFFSESGETSLLDVFGRVARSGEPMRHEQFIASRNQHVEVAVFSPRPGMLAAIVTDITLRVQAEEALRASEQKHHELADSLPQTIFECDMRGTLTFGNRSGWAIFGLTPDDIKKGVTVFQLLAPEDRARAAERFQQVATGAVPGGTEFNALRPDGSTFPVMIYSTPLVRGNAVVGLRGIVVDISEQKRTERALVARTAQLEAMRDISAEIARELDLPTLLGLITRRTMELVGAASGVIALWDQAGQVLRARAWHGYEDWIGDMALGLGDGIMGVVASQREGMIANDYRTSRHAVPVFLERTAITAVLAEPMLYQDRLLGVISVAHSNGGRRFTEREQEIVRLFVGQATIAIENARLFAELHQSYHDLERAQGELIRSETLRTLGQMAAGMAHDLNNMLAAILGQTELLRLRAPDPIVRDALNVLETAATDGAHVVRRLQDFARQRLPSKLSPVDLTAVVCEALEITRPRWQDEPQRQGRVIEIHTDVADLPPILGQAAEVREVLTNLIMNAVDAMPLGGTLTLAGTLASTTVLLTVTDTGVGMTETVRQRIFEPFFTTKGAKGTGLGLAVVYGIMERHQGSIRVISAPGHGTTFTLRFQVAPDAPAGASPPTSTLPSPSRILLIDDEVTVRGTVAALLRATGHTVMEADGGTAGLALLATTAVDIVITDLGMPELTGWDVARAVKERFPSMPVILLTGWGDQAVAETNSQGIPIDGLLGKPFRIEDLLKVLAEVTHPSRCTPTETAS